MNHLFKQFCVAIVLIGSLAACDKDSTEPLPNEPLPEFYIQAQLNGEPWIKQGGGFYATTMQRFTIYGGTTSSTEKHDNINLPFLLPKKELGALVKSLPAQVKTLPAHWIQVEYEDIVTNSFASDSLSLPSIQITRLDTVEKIVEGRFQATLQRDSHFTKEVELMRFREGSFRVRYEERAL